jgi:MoaA/NifB/PqqE/SkfB family radical SAM enzyme
MELSSLQLLQPCKCTCECEHCFVWGSPWQPGTMSLEQIRQVLSQARETGSIGKGISPQKLLRRLKVG